MKKNFKIIAACQDAGGCNAVYPVVKKLRREGHSIRLYASLYGAKILRRKEAVFSELSVCNFNCAGDILDREKGDLVLLGTSMGFSLEDVFVEECRKRNIPSVAIFDSWINYSVRFCAAADKRDLRYLPDYICVSDDFVREEMKKEGIPAHKIIVTGNPYFDGLLKETEKYSSGARKDFLAKLGNHFDPLIVTFLSQGIDRLFGASVKDPGFLGFTQFDALKLLITGLEKFYGNKNVILVIRPHPKEDISTYRNFEKKQGNIRIIVDNNDDARKILAISDIVAGMFSIMLVEAYILGKKILSIQPCLLGENPFILSRMNIVKNAGNLEELGEQLNQRAENIKDKRNKLDFIMPGESTGRVIDFIKKVFNEKS